MLSGQTNNVQRQDQSSLADHRRVELGPVRVRLPGDVFVDGGELTPGGANGGVMATAAYANGVIYVASNDGNSGGDEGVGGGPGACTIFALNATDGTVAWQVPSTPGTFGALTVANGVLYARSLAGEIRAYDVDTGTRIWSQAIGMSMGAGVTVSTGMIFAGHGWVWAPIFPVPGGLVAYGLP